MDSTQLAPHVSIYSVGLLHDLALFIHTPDRAMARRRLRRSLSGQWARVRAGRLREAKSYFNGYLAEHDTLGTRAGTGWTRGRAYRDLVRHLRSQYDPS